VDVILTAQVSEQPRVYGSHTLLHDVRVLAVDQTYAQDKDQKTVLAKSATLELSPQQSEMLDAAAETGKVSLALRPLGETAANDLGAKTKTKDNNGVVAVIRYGMLRGGNAAGRGE
jgi:pilus assembly protein CpaB